MENVEEYRRNLWNDVIELAQDRYEYDQDAFFETVCELLRDSEAITSYQPASCRYAKGTNRALAIDGYDPNAFEMDESIVAMVCDDNLNMADGTAPTTIQAAECRKYFNAMHRFVVAACKGDYQAQAEESSEAYEFAQYIQERRTALRRVRLYFITDREYTGRDNPVADQIDRYTKDDNEHKVSWETHIWDIRRLMEASQAAGLVEHMSIAFPDGIAAVKAPDDMDDMDTYLLFVMGGMLSSWYRKYGSKLMEANVRSFLSMRGKINKGIRDTINNQPDRFVAYNNGLTATATHVERNADGRITRLDDLQIVNGGQTTASIFYTGQQYHADLSRVIVPVKLVVVREEMARELVPNISRYTNSQNKVAEADFSSNSEYQMKLEKLSRQTLTPPLPGKIQTHWYYERARGQYDSERNRMDTASRKAFEKANPSKQRIKMVDAPKYLVCWDEQPQIAALGAQKCFAKFVNAQAKSKDSVEKLDTDFYKELVCKRIMFDTVYKHVKKEDWYLGAYQVNVTEYAIAKYAHDLGCAHRTCDFTTIWRQQAIDDNTLNSLLRAGEQASEVLNDPNRPLQNVSEWAKKDQCWENLRMRPSCLAAEPMPSALSTVEHVPPHHPAEATLVAEAKPTNNTPPLQTTKATPTDVPGQRVRATPANAMPKHKLFVPDLIKRSSEDVSDDEPAASVIGTTTGDADTDYQRDFLMAVPKQNWAIILQWGQDHQLITQQMMPALAKLSNGFPMTEHQTTMLWELRKNMIRHGFSSSLFEPPNLR